MPCSAAGSITRSVPSRNRTKSLTPASAIGSATRKCRNALAAGNGVEISSTITLVSMKSAMTSDRSSSRLVKPSQTGIPINCHCALSYANASARRPAGCPRNRS